MKSLTYIEIDVPRCTHTYGVAPCTASIFTGSFKCYNSPNTCQDRANYNEEVITLRFAVDTVWLPSTVDIEIVAPSVVSDDLTPGTVSLGEDLGTRTTLSVTFRDHPFGDVGDKFDKYREDRGFNPLGLGTFFGKFRARHPFLRNRAIRLIRGVLGQSLAQMETRHYVIESFSGPTPDGVYTLEARDVLKQIDNDRAQVPSLSGGFLVAGIGTGDTSLTLSPTGVGDEEYSLTGYVNLGGSEVVSYVRDQYTVLLAHFDGVNGAVTSTDSSPRRLTLTFGGAAAISTAQSVFGGSSLQLGAAANIVSITDDPVLTFGTNPIEINFRVRFTAVPAGAPDGTQDMYLLVHETTGGAAAGWYVTLDGTALKWIIFNAAGVAIGRYQVTHGFVVNTWYDVTITRSGATVTIKKDGTALTLTTTTDLGVAAIPDMIGPLVIGGHAGVTGPGWMDEIRIRNGIVDHPANFTLPVAAYAVISSGDILFITRAQYNTLAAAHSVGERAQICREFLAQNAATIIEALMAEGGLDTSLISTLTWQTEVLAYNGNLYSALITEPTGVNDLVSELVQQAALSIWWDDIGQQLRLRVLRKVATDADRYSEEVIKEGSFSTEDQPDKRVSRVFVYFARFNPLIQLDQLNNYRSAVEELDLTAEEDYGSSVVKVVTSRWIPFGGRTQAIRLADILIARYRDPPRRFSWMLQRYADTDPVLGEGYQISHRVLQDSQGTQIDVPVQVTRVRPDAADFTVEAEEALFAGDDLVTTEHPVIIDTNSFNINLRTLHDSLYPVPTPADNVVITIAEGIIVGSTNTNFPAIDVGSWPVGVTPRLDVVGRVQGAGGHGGEDTVNTGTRNGKPGGPALYTRAAINVHLNVGSGQIWGGGGGGGCGLSGGGGGCGQLPGPRGSNTPAVGGFEGTDGTTETGGTGGPATGPYPGGADGGGPGLAGGGVPTGVFFVTFGGAAGAAVDGISHVTYTGAGDRRGAEIN